MRTLPILTLLALAACATRTPLAPYAPPPRVAVDADAPDFSTSTNVAIVAVEGGTAETSIAVSPRDPNRVVVVGSGPTAGRIRRSVAYTSKDAGATWSAKWPFAAEIGGKSFAGGGDPVITVDADGRFYFASLLVGQSPSMSGLAVARSDDGGETWNAPALVSLHSGNGRGYDDKEWIAADDTGGPHRGNVYLMWGKYAVAGQPEPGDIVFSRSTDRGETWSAPLKLSISARVGLSELEVGPNGEVYASFFEAAQGGYILFVSRDGGATFEGPKRIPPPPLYVGGKLPNVAAQFRPMQSFAVDRSQGPNRGTLYYLMPCGVRRADGTLSGGVSLTRSTDGGATWSEHLVVSGDTRERDAFLPSIAVDNATGEVLAAWVDRRDDAANTVARLYASRSSDGGRSWTTPAPFSAPFSIDAGFVGDYNGAAAHAGRWLAAFSDAGGFMSVARIHAGQFVPDTGGRRRSVRR